MRAIRRLIVLVTLIVTLVSLVFVPGDFGARLYGLANVAVVAAACGWPGGNSDTGANDGTANLTENRTRRGLNAAKPNWRIINGSIWK